MFRRETPVTDGTNDKRAGALARRITNPNLIIGEMSMKKVTKGFFIIGFWMVLQAAPALADVTNIIGGIICGSSDCSPNGAIPVLQGKKTTLLVDGQDVNFADKNNVDVTGSGVSARITRDFLVSPKFGLGTGRVEVELNIGADATPGERTVTLN